MRSLLFVSTIMGLMMTAQSEKVSMQKKVSGTIETIKTTYTVGEHPKLKFTVLNNSGSKIILVKSLDGSDCGFRQPQASLQIFNSKGKILKNSIARCGNTNILQASDFVSIESGKKATLASSLFLPPGLLTEPGTYTVKLHYSTMNDDFHKWAGGPMGPDGIKKVKKECGALFDKREKVTLSAELKIKIVAKAE